MRTVINGHTSVVRLPGTVHRQVVGGKTTYIFRGGVIEPAPAGDSGLTDSGHDLLYSDNGDGDDAAETVTTPPRR